MAFADHDEESEVRVPIVEIRWNICRIKVMHPVQHFKPASCGNINIVAMKGADDSGGGDRTVAKIQHLF